jgi:2-dehydro-3-deoxy-D-gluconate 5-dehydrogenase
MVAILQPTRESLKELLDLTGKSAVVTGGAMGIGFGIASRLAEAGAEVTIVDLDRAAAEASARKLTEAGLTAQAVRADVRSSTDVDNSLDLVLARYGRLDIWVNNAGIYPARPVLEMSEDEWDRVIGVNLKGTFLCSQAAARQMMAQGQGGVIINVASIDAVHPSMVGLAHYDASKGGTLSFTKNLALELAPHNIRVLAIAPGAIATEGTRAGLGPGVDTEQVLKAFEARIPLRRMGVPDDIGRVALFLASNAAAYMTGTMVYVDGGVLLA